MHRCQLGRLATFANIVVAAVILLACCSPPPELDRPSSPPTAKASDFLPANAKFGKPGKSEHDYGVLARDGERIVAERFDTATAAGIALQRIQQAVGQRPDVSSRSSMSFGDARSVKYFGAQVAGLAWSSGQWVFSFEAPTAERVTALIRESGAGGLGADTDRDLLRLFPVLLLLVVVIGAFGTVLIVRLGLRATAVAPAAGVNPVSRAELIDRLLRLNQPQGPIVVRQEPTGELVVEWKFADATWWGLLAKSGVRNIYRLRLGLDERAHRVLALDEFSEVEWTAGALGAPHLRYRAGFFRGVALFRYQRGVSYGFRRPTGDPDKVLDYKFDMMELKSPVIEEVTAAGWSYQPALWRRDIKRASKM